MAFDNIDRNRYYGKRKGDIVLLESYDKAVAEVVEYGKDNNRLEVKLLVGGEVIEVTAEGCTIITKVEDRPAPPEASIKDVVRQFLKDNLRVKVTADEKESCGEQHPTVKVELFLEDELFNEMEVPFSTSQDVIWSVKRQY